MVPWLFLGLSIWGALFTANAIHPPRRPWPLGMLSFFPAWLTAELALHHLLFQAAATAGFVAFGALQATAGRIGLAITALSWLGLIRLLVRANRDGHVVRAALTEGLGNKALVVHGEEGPPGIAWGRVLWPFRLKRPNVERIADIAYVDDEDRRRRLDVYRPRDRDGAAPVLLQLHGGAWVLGEKHQQGIPLMTHMASRGWMCVAINYRVSPKATWPDHLVDCKLAVKWIREHAAEYGGDPDCVIVTGGSAGGHLTALMGLTANDPEFQPGFEEVDTRVDGFVPFYGVFDWTDRFGIRGRGDKLKGLLEKRIIKLSYAEHPEVFERASPMSHVDGDIPPAMLVHGANDTLAPVEEARKFVELLRGASEEPVVYVELADAQHAFEVFQSVRSLHAINGVEAFASWVADRRQQNGA